uniref:Protein refolding chaperone Spy/CpxP family n=1 Tax=Candidatus Kentrum sp. DK TaxID=2126562 RepID=A0A450RW73_9GAMM|nr:MAG: hypothetical protein BECKDK2373C_GA0170839_100531 [Candidatus Kentron sp. DK]
MGRYSYTKVPGKIGSYAFVLGTLAFSTVAVSQTGNAVSDTDPSQSAPPAVQQQPPMGYGPGGQGMGLPWRAQNDAGNNAGNAPMPGPMGAHRGQSMGGFMGMPQSGGYNMRNNGPAGMGYGYYGASPFDSPPAQQSRQPMADGDAPGRMDSTPPDYAPSSGMGASPFSTSHRRMPSGRGMAMGMNAAMPSDMTQGMFPPVPHPGMGSCGGKSFRGHGDRQFGANISRLLRIPELSDEQREKIYDILDELRRDHWKAMGDKMEFSAKLRTLHREEKPDAKAIGAVYGKIFDIERKMIESGIEAEQKARDQLTGEQRDRLTNMRKSRY